MLEKLAKFLFEIGMLKKTRRTGYQFLGSGGESVADHSFRTAVIGYFLADRASAADRNKVVLMCLFHDFPEARTGDHNYVNKRYVRVDEKEVLHEQVKGLVAGDEIQTLLQEFNDGKTLEARLAKDADQIDLILELKEQKDTGNPNAEDWLVFAVQRLSTTWAEKLARQVLATDSAAWWFDKKTDWWVNGPENQRERG